jgi:rSAM/selenodomain-associated transferase 2
MKDCEISVIIPAYNESALINATLSHVDSITAGRRVEIIVVDGHPGGTTLKSISSRGVIKLQSPRGRATQMNCGARAATGRILLFLHVDTRLDRDAPARILEATRTDEVIGGAFDLGIASPRTAYRLIEWMVHQRSRLSRIPYGDQAIFMNRLFFLRMDGYREMPLMEDIDLMRRVKKSGERIHIVPLKAWTSSRRWEREGVVFCTLRNWTLQIFYLLGVPPHALSRWYR